MKRRKKARKPETNRHHLLFQRKHWDKNGYALAIRNHFIYEMRIDKHDYIHANLHDIPLPPAEDLDRIYRAMTCARIESAYNACIWLANMSEFEPFKTCMLYQAELIKEGNRR